MTGHFCHTCEVLKEIYWLKASQFVLAARSAESRATGRKLNEDELKALKDDALDALRTLLRHVNSCYGFTMDEYPLESVA